MEVKKYIFPPHGDDRGQLVAIEGGQDLPFEITRVYYIYDTLPGVRREAPIWVRRGKKLTSLCFYPAWLMALLAVRLLRP